MLDQGSNSEVVYSPTGVKLALMGGTGGTTLNKAFIPLPGGATAVYNSSGFAYFRHSDHLGSSRFASTWSQTKYADYAYSPFGEPYAQSGAIDPSFTGQNQDTMAGLYDFLFREYDPNQTRWVQPDPAGLSAVDPTHPQSWNRYAYVTNNPLVSIDSLGLVPTLGYCNAATDSCFGGGGGGGDGAGGGNCTVDGVNTPCGIAIGIVNGGGAVGIPPGGITDVGGVYQLWVSPDCVQANDEGNPGLVDPSTGSSACSDGYWTALSLGGGPANGSANCQPPLLCTSASNAQQAQPQPGKPKMGTCEQLVHLGGATVGVGLLANVAALGADAGIISAPVGAGLHGAGGLLVILGGITVGVGEGCTLIQYWLGN